MERPSEPITNAMTVDVEDYFQVSAFERHVRREDWERLPRRVEANTARVLDLFGEAGVKATFFTLGWVAERHGALMRRIVGEGHELASHGYDHARVFTFTPEQFRADLARARAALEDAGGVAVTGYRAPSFSIDSRTPWAHPILAEAGYAYSSSVAPIRHDHYGWAESPIAAHRPVAGSDFIELPVTMIRTESAYVSKKPFKNCFQRRYLCSSSKSATGIVEDRRLIPTFCARRAGPAMISSRSSVLSQLT